MSITGYPVIKIKGKLEQEKCEVVDSETGVYRWVQKINTQSADKNKIIILENLQERIYNNEDYKIQ
jgi:hypothetical protein